MSKEAALAEEISNWPDRARDAWSFAQEQTREQPWRAVAVAAGAGYLLGGGLFSGLTARVLGVGLRAGLKVSAVPLISAGVAQWAGSLFSSSNEEEVEPEEPSATSKRGRRRQGEGRTGQGGMGSPAAE